MITLTKCQRRLLRDMKRGVAYSPFADCPGAEAFPAWTRRINLQPTIEALVVKKVLRRERRQQTLDIWFGRMHVTGRSWPVYFKA